MNRWVWFTICVLLGLGALVCGWLAPAYVRATDASVLECAGRNSPTLSSRGSAMLHAGELGPAELLSRAAEQEQIPSASELAAAVKQMAAQHPELQSWGAAVPTLSSAFPFQPPLPSSGLLPFTDFMVHGENRTKALGRLGSSPQPAVQELLRTRKLTTTRIFAPSQSAAGQAFDTAVAVSGLLLEEGKLTTGLSHDIYAAASAANRTGNADRLETILLDFMSLGQRFNWGQLVAFVRQTDDAETLHQQADSARNAGSQLPLLFAAVELSGEPHAVTRYLTTFPQTGLKDLGASLRFGAGGVQELLQRDQRFYASHWRQLAATYDPFATFLSFAAGFDWRMPWLALIVKWLLYLSGGFLLAAALHFARPVASALEEPLQVRGFHMAREFLFALGFLLVVLLLSEPFLAQESQATALPFQLRLPTVGGAVHAGISSVKASFMNQSNLLTMLLFFVLQGLLYTACVVKLAEIRRQRVGPRMKLKLLENEEHLFDAGLYLGFLGTIVSFIVYSMFAHHQFSLMVAYSSTSFGILFVSFFKIFHLRPVRRRLLLEAEAELPETIMAGCQASLASS